MNRLLPQGEPSYGPAPFGEDRSSLQTAALAGAGAAVVGALAWAAVGIVTGGPLGILLLGIGFLVGLAVRFAGRGRDAAFGVLGAFLTLAGCVLGYLLYGAWEVAGLRELPILEMLTALDGEVAAEIARVAVEVVEPFDLLLAGFAVYEAYKASRLPEPGAPGAEDDGEEGQDGQEDPTDWRQRRPRRPTAEATGTDQPEITDRPLEPR